MKTAEDVEDAKVLDDEPAQRALRFKVLPP